MKLLFFIDTMRGGGAERVMATLTDELVKRGHDITLVTMFTEEPFYSINKKIKLIQRKNRVNNAFFYRIKHRFMSFPFIRKTIKEEQPDVIISFMLRLNSLVLISSTFLGVPVIASEHSTFDIQLPLMKMFKRYQINKLAHKVTVLTEHDYNHIRGRLRNVEIMPNPLPFNPIEKYNIDRKKNIIAVGNLDRYKGKGFDNLIKIWSEIAHLYPDWRLQIAGAGEWKNIKELENLANIYNVSRQFEILGPIKKIDIKLRESSIFVLSSLEEGFGMALIEAMSQGCGCISFDCKAGPNEIITQDIDGILVEDQNMAAMREALVDLIENEEKREFLATNAIKSVSKFSVRSIVDKWEILFKEVITK